ncbi:uncharacterized protein EDB91DRAFT_311917 [Suillus paluster]|uniref:uncharacterized protein n=1 Tax=Suillus paluster TaxID=48578 RepID=UPI001B87E7C2|nr:uncharacterized protein EDB91DRAFT_311917 [Suillus paluster]KAG1721009.1 hypothetical protein EDB91DRAFT_311917 [Suillus paluster]
MSTIQTVLRFARSVAYTSVEVVRGMLNVLGIPTVPLVRASLQVLLVGALNASFTASEWPSSLQRISPGDPNTGVTETMLTMARYGNPNAEYPYVWYDIPCAGTLKILD